MAPFGRAERFTSAIQGVLGSTAEISGSFDRAGAERVAALISNGTLPLTLTVVSTVTR